MYRASSAAGAGAARARGSRAMATKMLGIMARTSLGEGAKEGWREEEAEGAVP